MITLDTKNSTSKAFSVIFYSFLDLFKLDINLKPTLFLKIFRTAIVADTLYQEGNKKISANNDIETEFLALLFESFILNVRIIYDLSMDVIAKHSGKKLKKSYNEFSSKISKIELKEIDEDFQNFVTDFVVRYSDKFKELKNIRDSIKRDTTADVYIKNQKFFVFLKYYDKEKKQYKILDEELSVIVFSQCALLCILAVRLKKMMKKEKNLK